LKHVETRWLSLCKCVDRAIRLWPGLKSYYLTHFDDDDDKTTEYYSAHPKREAKSKKVIAAREKRLVKVFKDPMSLVYCMFIPAVVTKFDHFNLLLQREEPVIYKIHLSAYIVQRSSALLH
jgi:sRNA-binding regulator protein Hfq